MTQDNKNQKRDIGAIVNFGLDVSELSNDEIVSELQNNAIDVDVVIPKMLLGIKNAVYGKTWTDLAYENKATMSLISKDISDMLSSGKENLLNSIRELILSGQLQVQHRDYKDLTEEDLLSFLEDAEFLRQLDDSKRKS